MNLVDLVHHSSRGSDALGSVGVVTHSSVQDDTFSTLVVVWWF